jgi:hypothetical protein
MVLIVPETDNFTIDEVSNTMLSSVNPALRNDMKKLLVILLMTLCASAMAQRHHGGGYWARGYGGGWQWMVPTIIGGAIVYEVARQQPVYVQQPVIIQQQQPVLVQPQNQSCSPWTETQNLDGTITRTRTCTQ